MGGNSLFQLLEIRNARAERAQNMLMNAVRIDNEADLLVKEKYSAASKYKDERPAIEQGFFLKYQASACDSIALDSYRHDMRLCEAEASKLQQSIVEAERVKHETSESVKSAQKELDSIKRKCEKLNVILGELAQSDALTEQRAEDNELDEWSTLTAVPI